MVGDPGQGFAADGALPAASTGGHGRGVALASVRADAHAHGITVAPGDRVALELVADTWVPASCFRDVSSTAGRPSLASGRPSPTLVADEFLERTPVGACRGLVRIAERRQRDQLDVVR
jgi:hypothetical protein